jgi:hypothetical protein
MNEALGHGLHDAMLDYFHNSYREEAGWTVDALGSYPQTIRVRNRHTGEIFEVGVIVTPATPIPGFDTSLIPAD